MEYIITKQDSKTLHIMPTFEINTVGLDKHVEDKLREEIKKLTGQLKEARDEITREYDGRCADNDENDAREEKLKEENEYLTDICQELNSIIPKCDGIDDIVCSVQLIIQSQ
tara:strand:- start:280 stop:615 length:336 start_codon:yes stop_codon:yes gene_type:complete